MIVDVMQKPHKTGQFQHLADTPVTWSFVQDAVGHNGAVRQAVTVYQDEDTQGYWVCFFNGTSGLRMCAPLTAQAGA